MLPNLPQHMIALLKILLAASPTSKAKSDSINIIADILPVDVPYVVNHNEHKINFKNSLLLTT